MGVIAVLIENGKVACREGREGDLEHLFRDESVRERLVLKDG